MKLWMLLLVMGCGACSGEGSTPVGTDVEPCDAPPAEYSARMAGEYVEVSRALGGVFVGGATLHTESRLVSPSALPAVVDFGAVQVRVMGDLTLCDVTSAPAE